MLPLHSLFRGVVLVLALAATLLLSGCIDVEEDYEINADGSGKVRFVMREIDGGAGLSFGGQPLTGLAGAKQALVEVMDSSVGIEAWSDLKYSISGDGKYEISGVGYFVNIAKVQLGYEGGSFATFDKVFSPSNGILELGFGDWAEEELVDFDSGTEGGKTLSSNDVTEEMIWEKIDEARREFVVEGQVFLEMMLRSLRVEQTFRLAGSVGEVEGFEQEGERYRYVVDGRKLMEAMKNLNADDAFMRKAALAELTGEVDGARDAMLEKLSFSKALLRAEMAESSWIFDYAAEVEQAKARFSTMIVDLGMENLVARAAPAAGEGGFASVELRGIELLRDEGAKELGFEFLDEPRLTLKLLGKFNGAVDWIGDGEVTVAIDETGESLLLERDWDSQISFPSLNEGGNAVLFEVKLNPETSASTIARVEGFLDYMVGDGEEWTRMGFGELREGAKGVVDGATVKGIGKSSYGNGYEVDLDLPYQLAEMLSFRGVLPDGSFFALRKSGHSSFGRTVSISLSSEEKIPAEMDIEVELRTGVKRYRAAFEVSGILIPVL